MKDDGVFSVSVAKRSSAIVLPVAAAAIACPYFCPRYAFGLDDRIVAAGLGAIYFSALVNSLINSALVANALRFVPDAEALWLYRALFLPLLIVLLVPSIYVV